MVLSSRLVPRVRRTPRVILLAGLVLALVAPTLTLPPHVTQAALSAPISPSVQLAAMSGAPASDLADPRFGLDQILPDYSSLVPGISCQPWASLAFAEGARFTRWDVRWTDIQPNPTTF